MFTSAVPSKLTEVSFFAPLNTPLPKVVTEEGIDIDTMALPVNAPYFENANLLVAADCTAYAYADFHNEFIRNRITLVGCPKLDSVDYAEKLAAIIAENSIKSVTVVRMEVPCCGGIENAVKTALQNSGKFLPWRVVTISTDGQIIE